MVQVFGNNKLTEITLIFDNFFDVPASDFERYVVNTYLAKITRVCYKSFSYSIQKAEVLPISYK